MPVQVDALSIPLGLAVLLAGTVALVVSLTAMARVVDRLIDIAVAARARPVRRPRYSRPCPLPRTVVAGLVAGLLLFGLAWFTFVLARARDLG